MMSGWTGRECFMTGDSPRYCCDKSYKMIHHVAGVVKLEQNQACIASSGSAPRSVCSVVWLIE